ncbi:MAG: class I tRNA ligase family protein [Patescibacteria group bacterium]
MDISITKIEEKILKFWNDREIFRRSLEARLGKKRFVFFEGPPTANGRPGIHHVMGRAFKDLWPRYKTMRGYYVERKAGWDTHGLPVEIEVEKELSFTNKKEIEKYGIAKFNAKAKKSVWKYKDEWQKLTHRVGFWLDLEHPYITYEPQYIESLWWVIAQIDKKKLLYEGHKVLPWCPRCGTALSSHEVAQGYKDVTEDSVYVKLKTSKGELLAWTTTPWTLPGNVALAVGEDIDYVKTKEGYILAKSLVEAVLGKADIVEEFKGSELVGLKYQPLFEVKALQNKKSHTVYGADFVTTTDGTGIVHTAVMYGEDDYELGKKLGLPMHHTVAPDGTFTKDVKEFAGRNVKEAEPDILKYLEAKSYKLKAISYAHSYPHCWRCKTPLIYYAKDSWFVGMSKLRKQLLKNNSKVNWYPEHLKEGRFGEFLKEVKDWAFSRERYWGTPLPIWKCKEGHQRVVGSFAELEAFRYAPPTTFLLVRHGESTRNVPGGETLIAYKLESDTVPLTETGKQQMETLAQKLSESKEVDLIYSSPFQRTKQSADIIAKKLGKKVFVDEGLKEYDHEHEDYATLRARMIVCLRNLEREYPGKKILVMSHADPIMVLNDWTLPEVGEMREFTLNNYPYNKSGELDPHRPYIDEIALKCDQCGNKMHRVKEVVDVWFDSGAMPYAQYHYPFENQDQFDAQFPADFISEAIDQTRGWFYTLLAVSTLLGKKAPYKNVVCYSHVLDEKGKKMSKSIGNVVNPWDVIEKHGVDATRWYFYSVNNPGDPKLFALEDVGKVQRGFITTLMNCLRFYDLYALSTNHSPLNPKPTEPLDDWILSRLHRLIAFVTESLDTLDPTAASRAIENFVVNDLSNWWIRRSRGRDDMVEMLRYTLTETSKLLAPFIPFTADHIYKQVSNRSESVHLEDWPKAKSKYIKPELEEEMKKAREIVALGLAERKKAGIKVRQPLASLNSQWAVGVVTQKYILDEVNVKLVLFAPSQAVPVTIDTHITEALKIEGYAREISRAIQDMRKDAGYQMGDKVSVFWESSSPQAKEAIAMVKDIESKSGDTFDISKEFELGPNIKVWLGIKR